MELKGDENRLNKGASMVMVTGICPAELQHDSLALPPAFPLLRNSNFLLNYASWRGAGGLHILYQSGEHLPGMVL